MNRTTMDELKSLMAPEFWNEITDAQLRWLDFPESIANRWQWCWDGKLKSLIVKHAPAGFFPPDAEERYKRAIAHLRRGHWQIIAVTCQVSKLMLKLTPELPECSDARSAFDAAAQGFERAMYDALYEEYDRVMEALAWNYAVPEFPEIRQEEVTNEVHAE